MSDTFDLTQARQLAAECAARADGATPGPWIWDINRNFHDVKLVTPLNGYCTVMDFVRWGMQGAQPRFSDRPTAVLGGIMHTVDEIDRTEPGLSAYPDATFIAAARQDVPALSAALAAACDEVERVSAERDALLEAFAKSEPWAQTDDPKQWKFYCVCCGESYDNVHPPEFPEHGHKDDCLWARSVVALRQARGEEREP